MKLRESEGHMTQGAERHAFARGTKHQRGAVWRGANETLGGIYGHGQPSERFPGDAERRRFSYQRYFIIS